MEILSYPKLHDVRESTAFIAGSQVWLIYLSGNINMQIKVSMAHWCNGVERVITKGSVENLHHWHSVKQKSYVNCPGNEPGSRSVRPC